MEKIKFLLIEFWNDPFEITFKIVRICMYIAIMVVAIDWAAEEFYQHFISGVK